VQQELGTDIAIEGYTHYVRAGGLDRQVNGRNHGHVEFRGALRRRTHIELAR
jgi:hypothetical protein